MMLVPTIVKESIIPGAGMGLFAAEAIPAGTIVWRWSPPWDRPYTAAEVAQFDERMLACLNKYGWRVGEDWRVSVDDSRFTNHSKRYRNIRHIIGEDGSHHTVAVGDIAKGLEILEDYSDFDPDFATYADSLRELEFREWDLETELEKAAQL